MAVHESFGVSGKLNRRRFSGVVVGLSGIVAAACGQASGTSGSSIAQSPGASGAAAANTFANPNLVVDVSWMKQQLKDPNVRIVDTRPAADYARGHLPGAVSLPVTESFDPDKDKNYPDTVEKLEVLFGSKGIGNSLRVITYDGGLATQAGRLFWTLEYAGHTNVAIMDGGLRAWQAANGEVTTEVTSVAPAKFTSSLNPAKLSSKEQCEIAINDPTKVILDTRTPEEYRGDDVRAKFGGHIPGAVNIDWRENLTADGLLKPPATLRAMYESKGVTKDKEIIALCQTGQRSSVSFWTLRLLGYPKIGNYAGSWIEWGNDPATLKVQGPSPK
jgi:thiosulfate/3-mercaptopyruvate sulfurtransferase